MSNTNTIETVSEEHIVAGAKVIATLDIASRMTSDAEIEAGNILNGYESHVAWQKVFQRAVDADEGIKAIGDDPADWRERKARKVQIIVPMIERYLASRNSPKK